MILFDELLEINKGSRFCNADVVVVDFSVREQCADLSYNLGGLFYWSFPILYTLIFLNQTDEVMLCRFLQAQQWYLKYIFSSNFAKTEFSHFE